MVLVKPPVRYTAFRVAFIFLVVITLVVFGWQCARSPSGPSRIGWPGSAPAKP